MNDIVYQTDFQRKCIKLPPSTLMGLFSPIRFPSQKRGNVYVNSPWRFKDYILTAPPKSYTLVWNGKSVAYKGPYSWKHLAAYQDLYPDDRYTVELSFAYQGQDVDVPANIDVVFKLSEAGELGVEKSRLFDPFDVTEENMKQALKWMDHVFYSLANSPIPIGTFGYANRDERTYARVPPRLFQQNVLVAMSSYAKGDYFVFAEKTLRNIELLASVQSSTGLPVVMKLAEKRTVEVRVKDVKAEGLLMEIRPQAPDAKYVLMNVRFQAISQEAIIKNGIIYQQNEVGHEELPPQKRFIIGVTGDYRSYDDAKDAANAALWLMDNQLPEAQFRKSIEALQAVAASKNLPEDIQNQMAKFFSSSPYSYAYQSSVATGASPQSLKDFEADEFESPLSPDEPFPSRRSKRLTGKRPRSPVRPSKERAAKKLRSK